MVTGGMVDLVLPTLLGYFKGIDVTLYLPGASSRQDGALRQPLMNASVLYVSPHLIVAGRFRQAVLEQKKGWRR